MAPKPWRILRRVTDEQLRGEAEGWRRLGATLGGLEELVEARQAFERALSIDPNVYWTLMAVGALCFRQEDLTAAEGYYRRAAGLAARPGRAPRGPGRHRRAPQRPHHGAQELGLRLQDHPGHPAELNALKGSKSDT